MNIIKVEKTYTTAKGVEHMHALGYEQIDYLQLDADERQLYTYIQIAQNITEISTAPNEVQYTDIVDCKRKTSVGYHDKYQVHTARVNPHNKKYCLPFTNDVIVRRKD